MKELIAKIRGAALTDAKYRCRVAAEVYGYVSEAVGNLSDQLDRAGLNLNVEVFEAACNEIKEILDELRKNFLLQNLLPVLRSRFDDHMYRHPETTWQQVEQRLREADPKKIWSLNEMGRTGGEPDVVGVDKKTGELIFQDRSAESPIGRRNCTYNKKGEEQLKRKYSTETCNGNALDMAASMGVDLLDETEYREAQRIDKLDKNSSSWLKPSIDKSKNSTGLVGNRSGSFVAVRWGKLLGHTDSAAFRASLKI